MRSVETGRLQVTVPDTVYRTGYRVSTPETANLVEMDIPGTSTGTNYEL